MPNGQYISRPMLHPRGLNLSATLPYELRVSEVRSAMEDIYDFLHNVNSFLIDKGWERLEETLSGATFSGLMSELVVQSLSKHSTTMTKNLLHNGRPDLLPMGLYADDAHQHAPEGIEVKASRYSGGWQGHNPESGWIMIFQYSVDVKTNPVETRHPTVFARVLSAKLENSDWSYSGRRPGSRRTITASIIRSGLEKLTTNWIYEDPTLRGTRRT